MLNWVGDFICTSKRMRKHVQELQDLDHVASIFYDRLAVTLPDKQLLLASLSHLSGLQCVAELHECQVSPAGQGGALALDVVVIKHAAVVEAALLMFQIHPQMVSYCYDIRPASNLIHRVPGMQSCEMPMCKGAAHRVY